MALPASAAAQRRLRFEYKPHATAANIAGKVDVAWALQDKVAGE
jgi:hypothetical protein